MGSMRAIGEMRVGWRWRWRWRTMGENRMVAFVVGLEIVQEDKKSEMRGEITVKSLKRSAQEIYEVR